MAAHPRTITVLGATGHQGRSVVEWLLKTTDFRIRAQTREGNANSDKAKDLKRIGGNRLEVVALNLLNHDALKKCFEGSYGVFALTMAHDKDIMNREFEIGESIARAAKEANVTHFVWSTLPNVEEISGGRFKVPHFTDKAKVERIVQSLNFQYHTFVAPPFYLQNFTTYLRPQRVENTVVFRLPMSNEKKVLHVGDICDLGKIVAPIFNDPAKYGRGERLYMASELLSGNEIMQLLSQRTGKRFRLEQVSDDEWLTFGYTLGKQWAEMFHYIENYTYFGPGSERFIENARKAAAEPLKTPKQWSTDTEMPSFA